MYTGAIEVLSVIAWSMILLPSLVYLFTSWRTRRDQLLALFDEEAIKLYYKQFFPSIVINADTNLQNHFKKHFGSEYGRRHYVLPLLILALLSGLGLWATAESVELWLGLDTHKAFPPIAISAFLGAYSWVLYDQLQRYRIGDFTHHDVYKSVYRFLIAIPLGISLSAFAKDAITVPFVFLLGAFPTQALFTFSRRIVSQKFGLGESQEAGQLELEQLQSIGRSNAERFQDEGITTIVELAWTDPIDLTIRTNREFSFVIDSISQALLWIYFEGQVKKFYTLSLRGAQEVCSFLDDLDSEVAKTKAAAETTLDTLASMTSIPKQSFVLTLIQVRDDPYAQFIFSIWT